MLYQDKESFTSNSYKQQKQLETQNDSNLDGHEKKHDINAFRLAIKSKSNTRSKEEREMDDLFRIASQSKEEQAQERIDQQIYTDKMEALKVLVGKGVIQLNTSEEVLDKRQLLNAGLNVQKSRVPVVDLNEKVEQKRGEKRNEGGRVQSYRKPTEHYNDRSKQNDAFKYEIKEKTQNSNIMVKEDKLTSERSILDAKQRYLDRKNKQQVKESDSE